MASAVDEKPWIIAFGMQFVKEVRQNALDSASSRNNRNEECDLHKSKPLWEFFFRIRDVKYE